MASGEVAQGKGFLMLLKVLLELNASIFAFNKIATTDR